MRLFRRLFAIPLIVLFVGSHTALAQNTPANRQVDDKTPPKKAYSASPANNEPRFKIPKWAECPQWWELARSIGFYGKDLARLDRIMYRESRCFAKAHNTTRNRDKSTDLGLVQINDRTWCIPSTYYPKGYLQTVSILKDCKQLFDPKINLLAARALYDYSKEKGGTGFEAWNL